MSGRRGRSLLMGVAAACAVLASCLAAPVAGADERSAPSGGRLVCRGSLSFGDALTRAVTLTVDPARAEIATPDCRKYPHLAQFCTGNVIRIGDHRFVFGGAESPENTRMWADLWRSAERGPASAGGAETLRVLFLGHCRPANARRVHHAGLAR